MRVMEEKGVVIEIRGGEAVIEMDAGEGCAKCGACPLAQDGKRRLTVENRENLKPGDTVAITGELTTDTISIVLTLLLPVVGLIAGVFLGYLAPIKEKEGMAVLGGAIGFIVSVFVARWYERNFARKRFKSIEVHRLSDQAPRSYSPNGTHRGQ